MPEQYETGRINIRVGLNLPIHYVNSMAQIQSADNIIGSDCVVPLNLNICNSKRGVTFINN